MLVIHVEHFLTPEGQRIFPEWIAEAASVLRDREGFISVQQLISLSNPDECHLLLEFESLELLRRWSSSQAHDQLIAKLAPYRVKKQQARIFQSQGKITARP